MKEHYILGYNINIYEKERVLDIIDTQGIYKDEFDILKQTGNISTKLIYCNKNLIKIVEIDELNNIETRLQDNLNCIKYQDIPKNRINFLIHSEKEENSCLGEIDFTKFLKPNCDDIRSPFQLIGKLSKKDESFKWLPFDELYLTYPLFTGIGDYLFLDYSNPLAPSVCQTDYIIDYPYGEINKNLVHRFERSNLKAKSIKIVNDLNDLDFEYWYNGIAGVPFWIQHPEIPRCPKNGKKMKFVCQISTTESVKVKESDVLNDNSLSIRDHQFLQFWGSGDLYVFIEPESKIVGYLIQDT
ncbi:hypothetical protein [Aquimarina algiphila]|uniref:Uncharacterized protein n=1 Tax=Aquimarina algiphila TaxID=2047982 RepID=A0A554VHH1_9FLAO|nr:hypothetical protein [Aquimarina algiphila]TSE06968.1 hypothetical protein FOF46_17240 [Aquimarina algiphila]